MGSIHEQMLVDIWSVKGGGRGIYDYRVCQYEDIKEGLEGHIKDSEQWESLKTGKQSSHEMGTAPLKDYTCWNANWKTITMFGCEKEKA